MGTDEREVIHRLAVIFMQLHLCFYLFFSYCLRQGGYVRPLFVCLFVKLLAGLYKNYLA